MKDIATITRTREIMEEFGLNTKKKFGQNFLTEPSIVTRIAQAVPYTKPLCILEVGPGIGALTEQLARVADRVIAYEIDHDLIPVLAQTLQSYPNVEIREMDFLKSDINELLKELHEQGYHVALAANLPYYITTPILFHVLEATEQIDSMTVMMQKEVADRFTAQPCTKDYNALTIMTQYVSTTKTIIKVPKEVFVPRPNVDSAVVQFILRPYSHTVSDKTSFFSMVKGCFVQRRKTMLNNFSTYLGNKEKAQRVLTNANIEPNRRAETLTLDEFIQLYEVLEND